jgi:putative NADPH-quinone reductase
MKRLSYKDGLFLFIPFLDWNLKIKFGEKSQMKVLIILGHPNSSSFNSSIATTVVNRLKALSHSVIFHDLYHENFDALIKPIELKKDYKLKNIIEKHCYDLQNADAIVIIHPNWWGQPPAILKGWIDRVIRPGVAYRFQEGDSGEGIPIGLLKAKLAIVINTSDTDEKREHDVFGDPLETIWKNCIFNFCGVTNFYRRTYRTIVNSSHKQRQLWLNETENMIDNLFLST